jgi:hypothetical protein
MFLEFVCGKAKANGSFFFCFSKVSSAIQNAKAKKLKNPPNARNSSICKIWLFALWQH